MPQRGSVTLTCVKILSASSYSNEWSQATARLNCCCASLEQEVGKFTRPSLIDSFSSASCLCCSPCCAAAGSSEIDSIAARSTVLLMAGNSKLFVVETERLHDRSRLFG